MAITVSSGQFMANTHLRLEKTLSTGWRKSSTDLIAIYNDLKTLEAGQHSKVNAQERWLFMLLLAGKCRMYLGKKEAKGKDLGSQKYMTVSQLETSLLDQVTKEKNKADALGRQVNQYQHITGGIAMGKNNPNHAQVKFEHAIGGILPNGKIVNGHSLWEAAERAGVKFTGNDNRDAYMLRAWMKKMAQSGELLRELDPLEYASDSERKKYELHFTATTCTQGNAAFSTVKGGVPSEDGACPFVIALDGTWYAKAGKFFDKKFHHSSFMSGQPVMLAGTMRVNNGKLLYISNNSGHYAPKLDDLLNGVKELRGCGLDQATRHDVSVLAQDFEGRYGAKGCMYLFPYAAFSRNKGQMENPANYEVGSVRGDEFLYWVRASASRPHHHAKVGAKLASSREPDAALIAWP